MIDETTARDILDTTLEELRGKPKEERPVIVKQYHELLDNEVGDVLGEEARKMYRSKVRQYQ